MIRRIYRFINIYISSRKLLYAWNFSAFIGSSNSSFIEKYEIKNNRLIHKPSGQNIASNYFHFFSYQLNSIDYFLNHQCEFINSEQGLKIKISTQDYPVIVKIASKEDIQLFNEIFILKPYSFNLTNKTIVVDVGMNIGFASLFFSAKNLVEKVYAYELIPATYDRAINNFELNEYLSTKIVANAYGLGSKTEELEIPYAAPGSVGASITSFIKEEYTSNINKTKVSVIDVTVIIEEILLKHSLPLVVKLDCEGAEYEIIHLLNSTNLVKKIHVFMIEWHIKSATEIVEVLKKNGFVVFDNFIEAHMPIGFIYAVNNTIVHV